MNAKKIDIDFDNDNFFDAFNPSAPVIDTNKKQPDTNPSMSSAANVISSNPFAQQAATEEPAPRPTPIVSYGGEPGDLSRFKGAKAISSDMLFNDGSSIDYNTPQ